jgi:hypothetical protein
LSTTEAASAFFFFALACGGILKVRKKHRKKLLKKHTHTQSNNRDLGNVFLAVKVAKEHHHADAVEPE